MSSEGEPVDRSAAIVALRVPQARKLAPRKEEGLLHRVLGPLNMPQDAVGDGEAAVAIEVDELGERILVAVTRPLDQRRTHRRSLSRWRPAWALHQVQMVAQAERFTDCLARVVGQHDDDRAVLGQAPRP